MDNTTRTRTIKQWAEMSGTSPDTIRKKASRTFGTSFGILSELSGVQMSELYPDKTGQKGRTMPKANKDNRPGQANKEKRVLLPTPQASANVQAFGHPKKEGSNNARTAVLYTLMLIPAAASLQNMHRVTFDIAGHEFAAVLLTGLFSASPFLFVLAGLKNRLTVALVACLVLYEAFCNFTRIYGGLTGFGLRGMPTRFLGLVTDVFNSGTHQTAVVLAVIMSLLAASVFYAAYNELRK